MITELTKEQWDQLYKERDAYIDFIVNSGKRVELKGIYKVVNQREHSYLDNEIRRVQD